MLKEKLKKELLELYKDVEGKYPLTREEAVWLEENRDLHLETYLNVYVIQEEENFIKAHYRASYATYLTCLLKGGIA
ncbi:hypothetical protein SORDD17_01682 [Streptococcus oralis]|uniref:DUF7763 domain-containing protein n=2 Tax=Streptococcus oralis TaxID=1303 RepID=A0A139RFS2_STROR|nr:hypothetical protein SORDD17_01682 [Streptococcus oralis]